MLKSTLIAAAAAALLFAGSASAQKLDANGRCHDAKGQFAKAEVCGGASMKASKSSKAAASATSAATPAAATAAATSAKPQRCKNDKGKFAKCGTPGAHPA
ncbi:MAG TPA: hypothetical protein VGN89_07890 [Phenylobacterium sp.]|nr:hypothetical protein [Phenylobacterium sp.]